MDGEAVSRFGWLTATLVKPAVARSLWRNVHGHLIRAHDMSPRRCEPFKTTMSPPQILSRSPSV